MNANYLPLAILLAVGNSAAAQQAPSPAAMPVANPAAVPAAAPAATPATMVVPAANISATPSSSVTGPDASGRYMLREGSDVNLQFEQDLSSKTSSEGDAVAFTLADDLKVGDAIVARAGAKAFGEVTKASKSGMMGKAGELNLRLNYLKVGDARIKLRGSKGKEGESGTTGAIVLTVLFGPLGLIKHGHNVEIKKGQAFHAYVSDDILVVPAS